MNAANKYFVNISSHGCHFVLEVEHYMEVTGYYQPDGFHHTSEPMWSIYCRGVCNRNFSAQATSFEEAVSVLTKNIQQQIAFELLNQHFQSIGRYYENR